MSKILLSQILEIDDPAEYKMHIAKYDGNTNPLDDFIECFDLWLSWNRWRGEGKRNRFNRKYVISFMDFYPQRGVFLFGGIFEILNTHSDKYDIKLLEEHSEFIGRLKVDNVDTNRGSSFKFEKHFKEIAVTELLEKSYSAHVFPGYENINYPFKTIQSLIEKDTLDWKAALENIKGVYMLTNSMNGKKYIGSAYGENGVWLRWSQYCCNKHGGNKELLNLVKKEGAEYIENNFIFTLLEIHPNFTSDNFIILRESHWKKVMMSTSKKFGYNAN